jgi:hypothetical protein
MSRVEHKPAYLLAASLCFVFLALPLLRFDVPPLVDYPNHLARVHILANYATDPFLQKTYRLILEPLPNLAMDLAATPLAQLFGTFAASRLFLVGMLFAYCWGCHALGAAGLGRWNWLAIPCFFTFYSSGFLWGFVNYVAGVAIFLLAFAWWLGNLNRSGAARWAVTAVLALLSYLSHLTAYGFVCVAAFAVVLMRLHHGSIDLRRAFGAFAPLAPPAFLYQYVRLAGERHDSLRLAWNSPLEKVPALLNLVRTYDVAVDAMVLLLLGLTALAALWWLRPVRIQPELGAVAATFFVLFLIAPRELFASSASGVDVRFVVPAAVVLLLALRFEPGGPAKAVLFAAVAVVMALRVAFIWLSWEQLQSERMALSSVIMRLPRERPACVVHAVREGIDEAKHDLALSHLYCVAAIRRDAVVPLLFTDPGAQPIEFRVPPPNPARNGYTIDLAALQDPLLWDYCHSFVTYRETPATSEALQRHARIAFEAEPYRLWRNSRP